MPRISLRKIDSLLNGELEEEESRRLREQISASPKTKAYFDRQMNLRSDLTWSKLSRAVEADGQSGPQGWIRRLSRLALGPVGPGWRRPALASGAFALLALGTVWWQARDPGERADRARFSAKGSRFAEAQLQVRGQGYPAGALIDAGPGDTLSILYRSADTVYAQVWYREEGGELRSFDGKAPRGFALPPVTAWTQAPQRVLLEGTWRRQEVWIALSHGNSEIEQVKKAIRSGQDGNGIQVLVFRFARGS